MALTQQAASKSVNLPGYEGCRIERGVFAFSTTDATGEIPVKMHQVHGAFFQPIGTPASDEVLSLDETFTDGICQVPATGTVTAKRTGAAKTSGLQVAYLIFGV